MNLQMGLTEATPVTCFDFETKEKIAEYDGIVKACNNLGCSYKSIHDNLRVKRRFVGVKLQGRRIGIYSRKLDKRVFFKLKK